MPLFASREELISKLEKREVRGADKMHRRFWTPTGFGPLGVIQYTFRLPGVYLSGTVGLNEETGYWFWSVSDRLGMLSLVVPKTTPKEAAVECEKHVNMLLNLAVENIISSFTWGKIHPTRLYARHYISVHTTGLVYSDEDMGFWGWSVSLDVESAASEPSKDSEPFHATYEQAAKECDEYVLKMVLKDIKHLKNEPIVVTEENTSYRVYHWKQGDKFKVGYEHETGIRYYRPIPIVDRAIIIVASVEDRNVGICYVESYTERNYGMLTCYVHDIDHKKEIKDTLIMDMNDIIPDKMKISSNEEDVLYLRSLMPRAKVERR